MRIRLFFRINITFFFLILKYRADIFIRLQICLEQYIHKIYFWHFSNISVSGADHILILRYEFPYSVVMRLINIFICHNMLELWSSWTLLTTAIEVETSVVGFSVNFYFLFQLMILIVIFYVQLAYCHLKQKLIIVHRLWARVNFHFIIYIDFYIKN